MRIYFLTVFSLLNIAIQAQKPTFWSMEINSPYHTKNQQWQIEYGIPGKPSIGMLICVKERAHFHGRIENNNEGKIKFFGDQRFKSKVIWYTYEFLKKHGCTSFGEEILKVVNGQVDIDFPEKQIEVEEDKIKISKKYSGEDNDSQWWYAKIYKDSAFSGSIAFKFFKKTKIGRIERLEIVKQFRGKGLGTKLFSFAIYELNKHKWKKITLEASTYASEPASRRQDLKRLISYYKKFGAHVKYYPSKGRAEMEIIKKRKARL